MINHAVIAIELAKDSANRVLERAFSVLPTGTSCAVVHVVEPQQVQYSVDPTWHHEISTQFKADAIERARKRVLEICEPFEVPEAQQHILFGHVASELHHFASENSTDCIMMGAHGTRGWRRILGSTAQSVLHGTPTHVWLFHLPISE